MNIEAEKLSLVELLLHTDNESVLEKVKSILTESAAKDETAYLLSTKANRDHLSKSISQLDKGKGKAIKTSQLWK
jgi:hypothetical protein